MNLKLSDVEIKVTKKDIKNLHLSVTPPFGEVKISAPLRMDIESIRAYAITKLRWIRQERKKFLSQEREPKRDYLNRESHYVWGKRYLLEVLEVDSPSRVELGHSYLTVKVRSGVNRAKIKGLLDTWYRNQIKMIAPEIISKYSDRLDVSVDRLYVQEMKTQWGACNPSRKSIRLNTDLARKPQEYLEYVILHELVHMIEPTHNAHFTALMDINMPNWRHYRNELNRLPLRSKGTI